MRRELERLADLGKIPREEAQLFLGRAVDAQFHGDDGVAVERARSRRLRVLEVYGGLLSLPLSLGDEA